MYNVPIARAVRRARSPITLVAAVSVLLAVALPAQAGNSPYGDVAAPWPASFAPYTYQDGRGVSDVQDENPDYSDLWAGSSGTLQTVYFTSDGTNIFFRFRLRGDPYSKNGGFASTSFLVSIASAGTQAAVVGLNGKPSAIDYVYTGSADGSTVREVYTTPFTNDGSGTSAGARYAAAPDEGFFLDFQVPISQITAVAPAVTGSTPIQMYFGSSQAANLAVINKDFMIGDSVSYLGLATVRLDGVPVTPPNGDPVAVDDVLTTDAGMAGVVSVLANDSDPDGDSLAVAGFDAASVEGGTVSCAAGGDCTYTPPVGFSGTDSFTYTVGDGNGGSATGTVTVTVDPVAPPNSAPSAVDDARVLAEDNSAIVNVLANDSDADGDPLSVTGVSDPANGTAVVNGDGTVTYTPDPDFNGTDFFTYTVDDGQGGTATATVTMTVNPVNDEPLAGNDTATVQEDGSVVVPVLGNDGDVDGDPLTVTAVSPPPSGTALINGDGTVTYTPDPDFFGSDSFTYTVCDPGGLCDVASVAVTVDPVNDDPVARTDVATLPEDGSTVIAVLTNDSDVDGDALSVVAFDAASVAGASVSCTGGGDCTYTPPPDFSGTDSFTYTVGDGAGGTATTAVTLTVVGVNDSPMAVDDLVSTVEDTPLVVLVLANDSDPEGDTLTIDFFTQPASGAVADNGDGSFTYTPEPDFNGTVTFLYRICDDGSPSLCDEATVNLIVTPDNDAPLAGDDAGATDEDTAVTIPVLGNDIDPDGDALTVTGVSLPGSGTAIDNGNGTITYTPTSGYSGTDTFTYTVCDGGGLCAVASVRVVVASVNDRPVAVDDAVTATEDLPLAIAEGTLLGNDSDPDGPAPLTINDVTDGAHGTVSLIGGTITYTPDLNYNGPDSFTYSVCDGAGGCDIATVDVAVDPQNDLPVARDDTATTAEDTPVDIVVLGNDTDLDGDPLRVSAIVTPPTAGTATINGDGTVTYSPAPDFFGVDEFEYSISDDNGGTATAWARFVMVNPVNDPPVAGDNAATVAEDGSVVVPVLSDDTDVEGDPLSVAAVSNPANGTVVINGGGTVTYTPDPDFFGTDSFTYTVCDNGGLCDVALVTMTVDPVNDDPAAVNDTAMLPEDGSATVAVLANDTDIDGDPLSVAAVSDPANGTVVINGGGTVTYTPDPNSSGSDSFTYTVDDGAGGTATGTVTVTVSPVNDAPVAADETASATEDGSVSVNVVASASDADGDALSVTAVSVPGHATVVIDGDGTVTYTPDPDYFGPDFFTYTVCDDGGLCDVASVAVTVDPVNDDPVAVDDMATLSEDGSTTVDVLANDTDVDGDPLSVAAVSDPANGTVVITDDGMVAYTPNADFFGTDLFTYTVDDGAGGTDFGVMVVTVEPINDPPLYHGPATIPVAVGGTPLPLVIVDIDGDPMTVSVLTGVVGGLVLNPDGTWSGTAVAGTYEITLQACDDAAPPACSVLAVVLQVELLPQTGFSLTGVALFAAALLVAGAVLIGASRRREQTID